jgi:Spy/CpxP family protein refolding chaperone
MKKTMIALGLVAVMILGFTYAYAQGPGFGPGHRGMDYHESWGPGKVSNLTPEQKTKFQELRQKLNEETAQLKGALLTKRLELQSLWINPKADSKAIMDKEKELRELQNQMKDKVVQFKLEARKLLTPEQITEFGPGRGMGHGFGGSPMMGHGGMMGRGQGMGPGYGMCN